MYLLLVQNVGYHPYYWVFSIDLFGPQQWRNDLNGITSSPAQQVSEVQVPLAPELKAKRRKIVFMFITTSSNFRFLLLMMTI